MMAKPDKPLAGENLQINDALRDGDAPILMGMVLSPILGVAAGLGFVLRAALSPATNWPALILPPAFVLLAAVFLLARHVMLCRDRAGSREAIWAASSSRSEVPDTSGLPAVYFTYVLGSGGHTGELCELIKQSFRGHDNLHRRYVLTSGDTHSPNIVAQLETLIRDHTTKLQSTGTWDVVRVRRARHVHQPLWTTWFTAILSAVSIARALVLTPRERPRKKFGAAFRYPHVIVTNGPGTGFVVCLVAHFLKLLFLAPADRMKVAYIETWAHISTLSLTGKLFYYTDIADLFLVQHEQLASKTGKPCLQLFKPPVFARNKESKMSTVGTLSAAEDRPVL